MQDKHFRCNTHGLVEDVISYIYKSGKQANIYCAHCLFDFLAQKFDPLVMLTSEELLKLKQEEAPAESTRIIIDDPSYPTEGI